MKTLKEYLHYGPFSYGFNEYRNSHKKCYNKLLKWYEWCISSGFINKDEAFSCLKYAIKRWKDNNFDDL